MQVYIHIPFCESKCPYCAFGSVEGANESLKKAYFDALATDLNSNLKQILAGREISSVLIGGGTPSAVRARLYEPIFAALSSNLKPDAEITSEANPNSASFEWLSTMRKFGVNRVSFGAQSFDEKKLRFLGRIHGTREIYEAVANARNTGFENINVDLIYGTRLDNKKLLAKELENISNLNIPHVSAYSLTIEAGTPFARGSNLKKDGARLAKFLFDGLSNLNYSQYEISNFARENGECRHNLGYWAGAEYAGFGAFSVGFVGDARYYASSNLKDYIAAPSKRETERLTDEDMCLERVFLGLRSRLGVDISNLKSAETSEKIEILRRAGKIEVKNGRIYNKNFLLADEIALFLT